MIGITTAIILDTRAKRKDGTYPLKLRLTYERNQKYLHLKRYLSESNWNKYNKGSRLTSELKELSFFLKHIESKAIDIANKAVVFSLEDFKKQLIGFSDTNNTIIESLKKRLSTLEEENRISTAITYRYTIKSIEVFNAMKGRKTIQFAEITPEWLQLYENWMLQNGKSVTTIGIYLRNLRTIINEAIDNGNLPRDKYPFSKNKYTIPSARNIKKAVTIQNIKQIVEYAPKSEAEERARDMWLFCYLCNGINMKDVANLKFKNLDNKHIYFVRSKTQRATKGKQKTIVILRMDKINEIIQKWGNLPDNQDDYIFPILSKGDTPKQEHEKVKQAIKTTNKYTKRIAKELGLDLNLTTYSARHSFATVLKRSGASSEYIRESLGHSSERVTQNYLDSFEDDTREKFQNKLLDF
ncbi:MAG: tyrosine-type recombinase/integrase [Bacteroidales bacterium]